MAQNRGNLMTSKEAARYLRASMLTLSKIESEGGLVPYRTPGGAPQVQPQDAEPIPQR
jgi:hypothetical protein